MDGIIKLGSDELSSPEDVAAYGVMNDIAYAVHDMHQSWADNVKVYREGLVKFVFNERIKGKTVPTTEIAYVVVVSEKPKASWVTNKCHQVHTNNSAASCFPFRVVIKGSPAAAALPDSDEIITDPQHAFEVIMEPQERF